MITSYTYRITNVNKDIAAMEVEFSSPGLPTVLVGARMPYVGEDLDTLVRSFAPMAHWETFNKPVADVSVGHTAEVVIDPIPAPVPPSGLTPV